LNLDQTFSIFIVDVSATSLPLSKWLPVSIFSARCHCCGEKCVVEMWRSICR